MERRCTDVFCCGWSLFVCYSGSLWGCWVVRTALVSSCCFPIIQCSWVRKLSSNQSPLRPFTLNGNPYSICGALLVECLLLWLNVASAHCCFGSWTISEWIKASLLISTVPCYALATINGFKSKDLFLSNAECLSFVHSVFHNPTTPYTVSCIVVFSLI